MHFVRLFRSETEFYEARSSFGKMNTHDEKGLNTEEDFEKCSKQIVHKKNFLRRQGPWIQQVKGEGLVEQNGTDMKDLLSICIFSGNREQSLFTTINSLDSMVDTAKGEGNFKVKKGLSRIVIKFPFPKLRKQKRNHGDQGDGSNVNVDEVEGQTDLSKKKLEKEYVICDSGLLIDFPDQNNFLFGFKLMFRNKCMIDKKALNTPLSPRDIGLHFEAFHKRLIAAEMNRLSFLTQSNYDK